MMYWSTHSNNTKLCVVAVCTLQASWYNGLSNTLWRYMMQATAVLTLATVAYVMAIPSLGSVCSLQEREDVILASASFAMGLALALAWQVSLMHVCAIAYLAYCVASNNQEVRQGRKVGRKEVDSSTECLSSLSQKNKVDRWGTIH